MVDSALIRRILWNVVPAALVVGVAGSAILGDEGLLERHALKQRMMRIQGQVERLEDDNRMLRADIHRLRTDPVILRRAVAERLYLAEPGGTIYRFGAANQGWASAGTSD